MTLINLYIASQPLQISLCNERYGQIGASVKRYLIFRAEHLLFNWDNLAALCFCFAYCPSPFSNSARLLRQMSVSGLIRADHFLSIRMTSRY